jgi:hypothetical protein
VHCRQLRRRLLVVQHQAETEVTLALRQNRLARIASTHRTVDPVIPGSSPVGLAFENGCPTTDLKLSDVFVSWAA